MFMRIQVCYKKSHVGKHTSNNNNLLSFIEYYLLCTGTIFYMFYFNPYNNNAVK